jgi:dephospho-CoA kinase
MKVVIGLAGVKTSGKSTVANIIKKLINTETVEESAIADKLKNVCAEAFGVPRDHFDNQDIKEVDFEDGPKILTLNKISMILHLFNVRMTQELVEKYKLKNVIGIELPTPRRIAQVVGTEVLRTTGDEDIHCKNMPLSDEDGSITVVSDLRFPNEFSYFHSQNFNDIKFLPIYIQRDEAEKHVTEDSHPSEKSVFLFSDQCVKLSNNGTLEDLEKSIKELLLREGYISEEGKESKGA